MVIPFPVGGLFRSVWMTVRVVCKEMMTKRPGFQVWAARCVCVLCCVLDSADPTPEGLLNRFW